MKTPKFYVEINWPLSISIPNLHQKFEIPFHTQHKLKITLLILGHWHFLGLPCCQSFCPDPPINNVVTFCIQRHSTFPPYSIFIWRWCCISLSVFGIIMAASQTEMKNHLRIAWCKMRFWHLQQKVIEVCMYYVSSIVPTYLLQEHQEYILT